jgi:UDP-2,4-diacetamido-2,4,6-trideoxy-beta-L-altropyranose hydrolase
MEGVAEMHVLLRCDAGGDHGLGHATRCLALAQALAARGAEVRFASRTAALQPCVEPFDVRVYDEASLHHSPALLRAALEVDWERQDVWADVIVLDIARGEDSPVHFRHYRSKGIRVVLIDHLPQQPGTVDLVVLPHAHQAPTILERLARDFPGRVLHGWDYAMLAPEVTALPPIPYAERAQNPVVFCAGGSDPKSILACMHGWAQDLPREMRTVYGVGQLASGRVATVHASPGNTHVLSARQNAHLVPFGRDLLRSASLVVTMLGQTVYEALYWQTPTLAFARTADDAEAIERLQGAGVNPVPDDVLPYWPTMTRERFCALVEAHCDDDVRLGMHTRAAGLIDGHGIARVADAILALGN